MTTEARHWLATAPGVTDEVSDDAYVWLDAEATGQHGQLWVVADGHGPAEGCGLASAVVVHTIADEYPELIEELGAPFAAMTRCMEIASERVRTMATSQGSLNGMTVSCAAIAEFDGLIWAVSVGTARAYVLRGETLERISTDQVSASHVATDQTSASRLRRDDVVVGALGSERPSIVPCAGGPIEPDGAAFLLATEGTWRALTSELMIGALERMQPRTAVDAMLEVGLMKFADCAMTACIIRYSPLDIRRVTGRVQFLAWAAGDSVLSAEANKTLMLDPAALVDHGAPTEHLHPPQIPNVGTAPQPAEAPELSFQRTALFSLQDIHSALAGEEATGGPLTVAAAEQEGSPTDRNAPITAVGAAVHAEVQRTTVFSPQLVKDAVAQAKAHGQASGGSAASTSSSTMAFSPQDLAAFRAAEGGEPVVQSTEAAPGRVEQDASTTLEEEPIEKTAWVSHEQHHRPTATPGEQTGTARTLDAPAIDNDALRSDTMFSGTRKRDGVLSGAPPAREAPQSEPARADAPHGVPTADHPHVGGAATMIEPSRPHLRSNQPEPSDTKTTPRKKAQIADPFADRWDGRDPSEDSEIMPYRKGSRLKRFALFLFVVSIAAALGFLGARYLIPLL